MNFSYYFPELNEGQLKMLERIMEERERAAIQQLKPNSNSRANDKKT